MKRQAKKLLSLALILILSAGLFSCGQDKKEDKGTKAVQLESLNWDTDNYNALQKLITDYGKDSKNYDKKNKPYAVFDWDNTSIMNDVEEALLIYQIENLEFKMTPDQFKDVLGTNLPDEDFSDDCNNTDGRTVNKNQVIADLANDYEFLYNNYEGMNGSEKLEAIHKTWQYEDFRAKLRYLYHAIGESFSSDVSYPWVTYLFTGMTSDEVAKLTEKSNDYWLGEELARETWISNADNPGQAGVVSVTFEKGLRTVKEMQNLFATLKDAGIDVYICSASYIDVVREFATNPKYGYNLNKDNVFAMMLEKEGDKIINKLDSDFFQTQGEGKVKTIDKFIKPTHGKKGPILVAGDSNGDFDMLTNYTDTKLSLIINRVKDGKIGELSKRATSDDKKDASRYRLQGRNNNTGEFVKSQKTTLLNETDGKLLKEE